ncbi:hypothetical protein BKH46_06765 [Helicobacter sp. 12S02634-8]|uniref:Opr family porin n=1 Tax=Helicobacter sp. 12S02634-8 TaxID=1476199 RepID=UPI000BA4FEB8|nr:Opr family porin [Helicobacter sp. 12S02634-8]PAF46665.1 hypothetical protein BKH46_06765 [Helicobacter sp. 12S02634-8]
MAFKFGFFALLVLCLGCLQAENGTKDFQAQAGFFSSWGLGRYGTDPLKGGYSNVFGTFSWQSRSFGGFDFGVGVSASGLLYRVKSQDIYADIRTNPIGIGFRINNDEAKDFRYTSTGFLLHTLFARYQNQWGSLQMGRFPLELAWVGDYIEGIKVSIDKFEDWHIQAGWFDKQAYSDAEENVNFGYIKHWYEDYEGYAIKNNYFLDIAYNHRWLDLNLYYNYFDTLLGVLGIKTDWYFAYHRLQFVTHMHYAWVGASAQRSDLCAYSDALQAGLACYVPDSMGRVMGYLWQLQQTLSYEGFEFAIGYLQNDKKNATNNLPIYADDNPLEYNTVVYGEGAATMYAILKFQYASKYFAALKYGLSDYGYDGERSSQSQFNAITGIDYRRVKFSLGYINIDDKNGYRNNITKFWIGFKF